MYSDNSFPILINVAFSGNTAHNRGGGIVHDGSGKQLTLINTILWGNGDGNIYLYNDSANTETVNLYHSLIEEGTSVSKSATGIRLYSNNTIANPININSELVIASDPILDTLTNNGGKINTISIGISSSAKNKGVYVRGVKADDTYLLINLYYSTDNTTWFSDPGLNTSNAPPNDAKDLTAIDTRGYGRVGRPDMGAYEIGRVP